MPQRAFVSSVIRFGKSLISLVPIVISMSCLNYLVRVPRGPFTVTSPSDIVTSVFSGITITFLPIRDMVDL